MCVCVCWKYELRGFLLPAIANSIWEDEHKIDTPDISGEETNINEKIEY